MTNSASDLPSPPRYSGRRPSEASSAMTLFVMIVTTLYFGREVLVPVTVALLLAFILAPLVGVLRKIHLGRVPSVLLGVVVALSMISAIGGVIGQQIAELSTDLPQYASTVETKIADVKKFTIGRLGKLADSVGRHHDDATSRPAPSVVGPAAGFQGSTPTRADSPLGSSPMDLVARYVTPILSPFATLGLVFVVTVFALLQREDLRDRLIRLIGSTDLHRTTLAIDDAGRRLSRYFVTQLCINTSFGFAIGLGLLIIGVPNPVLWAILSALLRFVPYVGSLISAVLPLALAAAVEPGWSMVLSTAALYVVAEALAGQVVEPLVYGHSTGLSPFSVVVAAIFWSWLWGPIGLILSTPLTLCLVVMGRHIPRLKFLDIMLGDKPALTPVESFYQRVLAGDADEAQDHAEMLLKERSLLSYYDNVALTGLQIATADVQRGVLDAEQLGRVETTIRSLIQGLERHITRPTAGEDVAPSPTPATTILCVAGRGPLDEAAAGMLVQILNGSQEIARLVLHREVSRSTINSLDMTRVDFICICNLDMSGTMAHLKYLVQRLRQRLAQSASIAIGFWPSDEVKLISGETRSSLGADFYVSSLSEIATIVEKGNQTHSRVQA